MVDEDQPSDPALEALEDAPPSSPPRRLTRRRLLNAGIFATVGVGGALVGLNIRPVLWPDDARPAPLPTPRSPDLAAIQEQVVPRDGFRLALNLGDIGQRLVEDGVIDRQKLARAVHGSDELPVSLSKHLQPGVREVDLNASTAHFWVDVLWAVGLANRSSVLLTGPMVEGGTTARFASTGGYTLGQQPAMTYYATRDYIRLSQAQDALVGQIAAGIYRPCCDNPTSFPDCNHGMAALGLIELMVADRRSADEVFRAALAFNAYWFPKSYLDLAYLLERGGSRYADQPPATLLARRYSSGSGNAAVQRQVGPIAWPALQGAGGCSE